MRRLSALALLALVVLAAPAARAEELRHGYQHTAGIPTFVGEPDRAYVAAKVGTESARAFVAAPAPFSLAAADRWMGEAAIGACPLTSPLVDEGEVSGGSAPSADCSVVTPVTRADDGAWIVSLDPWPAHGVALVPLLGPATTFTIAFDTTKTALVPTPSPAPAATAAPEPEPAPIATGQAPAPSFTVDAPVVADAPAVVLDDGATPIAGVRLPEAVGDLVRSAASPPALVVLPLVALVVGAALAMRGRGRGAAVTEAAGRPAALSAALVLVPPVLLSEADVYKLGLVLIVLTAAIGLHVLVTWAGELSLAQAPLVGLPAFAVAKLSADNGVSPIYLLPLAIAVGVVAGAVVGVPALRARGLQVALVTLAAGVAIDRFFFTREWVVGPPGGAAVPTPSLGPIELTTARALWPVLVAVVLGAVAVAWMIDRSKLGRGLRWVKAHPDAASSFGIPVSTYRTVAYALAGGFAGLAGGLSAVWVQRMTPQAFPLSLSFTYLIIVALAGRGFVGGVAAAALAVEGGRLFLASGGAFIAYAAPLGLILTLTRHQTGLNGLGRHAHALVKEQLVNHQLRVRTIIGAVLVAVGFAAIALAWYHAGNTDQVWVQNQELISGGIGGLALVVVGSALVVIDWLASVLTARTEP